MSSSILTYFKGVAAKRLSNVEINPKKSHQHEFNGTKKFKELFGVEKQVFKTKFIYLNDDDDLNVIDEGQMTWYDSREAHVKRTEHRMYYPSNNAISKVNAEDLMIICQSDSKNALVIFAVKDSTIEKQLLWLFGFEEVERKFVVRNYEKQNLEVGYARSYILESIGIEVKLDEKNYLDLILKTFGTKFPNTKDFSSFARKTLKDISPREDADFALVKWMEQEELLFKILEKHLVEAKLKSGFGKKGTDVDDFIKFSLSVHQRRKSRAGWAFDHHVAEIFNQHGVKYARQAKTEGKNTPDYIFPGSKEYSEKKFSDKLLTMLGLKTTAKDRWRQILSEAKRVKQKHLLTLEPSISKDQTDEMKEQKVQLIIPKEIIPTYKTQQQKEIIDFSSFIKEVLKKQNG